MDQEQQFEADIAVVGMDGRFPGARSLREFWENLAAGVESVSFFSREELDASGVPAAVQARPGYVPARGVLADADHFDAPFFGFTPREAAATDPQQRLFLECAWGALENAGYDPGVYEGMIGVFAGSSTTHYLHRVRADGALFASVGEVAAALGSDKDFLTTRVSYKLNLRGPSFVVQTACSTSLVAVHLACGALLARECDMALAGGVSVREPQKAGHLYQEGSIFSPDGHCRAFADGAAGTVAGSGVGVVLLKRLADALEDGDHVLAVIKGSAINNDGSRKVGFTAPSTDGQARAISEALAVGGVDPSTITCVEGHGTGTPLGDPIEVAALAAVLGAASEEKGFCALGSVKSNLGHLDAAAGVTGLIKTVLALQNRTIPRTLHADTPHPELRLDETPLRLASETRPWPADRGPRRAGVSSFGMGGTNAHVVLEEAPETEPTAPSRGEQLVVLSARTPSALDAMRGTLAAHLRATPSLSLADAAHTLRVGRAPFAHRVAVVAADADEAAALLEAGGASAEAGAERTVAFLFPGQGAQYAGMAQGLYAAERVFRAEVDRCCALLRPVMGIDLRTLLFPADDARQQAAEQLRRTEITQPALFVVEYALARLWMSWGIAPSAMLGHSVGEYVAACLAGVFSLESALRLVAIRGKLMQGLPAGEMLAVTLPESDAAEFVADGVCLAAVNDPSACVLSGPAAAMAALREALDGRGVMHRPVPTSHAFHSGMMDPVLEAFRAEVARARPAAPSIPFVSNVTGTWITADEAADPAYWAAHLRGTVRFADGVATLLQDSNRLLLETGPGRSLGTFARRHPDAAGRAVLSSLRHAEDATGDLRFALRTLGALWAAGATPDWTAFVDGERRRRVPLPGYAFERKPYAPAAAPRAAAPAASTATPSTENVPATAAAPAPQPVQEPMPSATPDARPARLERLTEKLGALFARLLGIPAQEATGGAHFLELGADSLVLMQVSRAIEDGLGVNIPFRSLLTDYATVPDLAAHLDAVMPPDEVEVAAAAAVAAGVQSALPAQVAAMAAQATAAAAGAAGGLMEEVIRQQLALMSAQLELLRGAPAPVPAVPAASAPAPAAKPAAAPAAPAANGEQAAAAHGPYRPVQIVRNAGFTEQQQAHLDGLIARYTARTPGSKALAAAYQKAMSDPRAAAGFRMPWKELCYQLVARRSRGTRVWDVDGNEYVDYTMGFGVHLFGHSPEFITRELTAQVELGTHLGLQTELAGEVAQLVSELTGLERVTFCNTGTEAVMAALRMARTATGREKVVMFTGAYHGWSDGMLGRARKTAAGVETAPVAPGITRTSVQDTLVLDYGDPASLEAIRAQAGQIAAVIVEPVQSRRPDHRPAEFVRELRKLTEEMGIALIFDEIITGFRMHPRGMQGIYGVQADLATYGKVPGGGLPMGIVAGAARFLDTIDGGHWSFGDGSYPTATQTFFAGTFAKNPLAMAAARAVLREVRARGPRMQEALNARTERFCAAIQEVFAQAGIAARVPFFGSLFRIEIPAELRNLDLLFYHMIERGVYVWEGRLCFVSTEHGDAEEALFLDALRGALADLRAGGFLPEPPEGGARRIALNAPVLREARSYPLTPAQRGIWVHTQVVENASQAYNELVTLRLRGALDVDRLRAALCSVVDRHDALRTRIDAGGEMQIVEPSAEIGLPLVDSSADWTADATATERAIQEEMGGAAFDLHAAPLLRAAVHRLSDDEHLFVLCVHHVVADGHATGVLLAEMAELYSAAVEGREAKLGKAMQFGDYAETRAAAPRNDASAGWWAEQYATRPEMLELPTDRPRLPAGALCPGRRETVVIDAETMRAVRRFTGKQGCTLLMTLVGGFCALLHRLSGQDDLVVGVPSGGRDFAGSERLMGHVVDLLPIRSTVEGTPGFAQFLGVTRDRLLNAFDRQDYTLGVWTGAADRGLAPPPPAVQAILNLDVRGRGGHAAGPRLAGLTVDVVPSPIQFAKFDLGINAADFGGELHLECDYNTALFDAQTVRRMLGQMRGILAQAAAGPETALGDLSLLDDAERETVLRTWNATAEAFPLDVPVHRLFEAWAEEAPEAIALTFEDGELTYEELNACANRLAHRLVAMGVGPESRVGVCLHRGAELVIALLAVVKAGGAYVPMDPGYPADRLAYMLEDSGVALLLSVSELEGVIPATDAPVMWLDRDSVFAEPAENLEGDAGPDGLMYVIYTSGSTGRPKGAMNAHRGLANRLHWMKRAYGIGAGDVFLQKTPFSFDVSVQEFFLPLMSGARLVVARPSGHQDPAYLRAVIEREGATWVHFVPSMLGVFLEEDGLERLGGLTRVFCSGEALPRELAERFFARMPPTVQLHNLYGPTEAAIDVSHQPVAAGEAGPVAIGRPVGNTRLYVLDAAMNPVAVGMTGELYIGGVQVGRGYLNRPGLTAEKFVPDAFGDGGRVYRTGDLARWRADGAIEYLGRTDFQVKVRGFRIELGEIESALLAVPGVREGAVIARGQGGDQRLVAYVAGEGTPETLAAALRRTLPEHMVPQAWAFLDALPLSPNGKLDRRALPEPRAEAAGEAGALTEMEALAATAWCDVLGVESVSRNDDFFTLGGQSLRAIRVCSRLRELCGVRLSPRALFDAPALGAFARAVEAALRDEHGPGEAPVAAVSRDGALPLSFAQERLWFMDRLEPGEATFNIPLALRLDGPVNADALERALAQVIARHEVLRTVYRQTGDDPEQVILPAGGFVMGRESMEEVDAAGLQAAVRARAAAEAGTACDLETGPVVRATLLRLAEERHVLLLTLHHVAADGWSLGVIFRELTGFYAAFTGGDAAPLPAPALQYADYAAWQRQNLSGKAMEQRLGWWTGQLAGAPTVLQLPTDFPRPQDGGALRGERYAFLLPEELSADVAALARREGATPFMLLLAVYGLLLQRHTGQDDLLVGTNVANRTRPELEGVVGLFVNTLALRVDLTGDPGFRALLGRVREHCLGAYLHQDTPFERLAEALAPAREPGRHPLFQALFLLQNVGVGGPVLPGVQVSAWEAPTHRAKHDLMLSMTETPRGLQGVMEYAADLFREETIVRMMERFQNLLESLVADPDHPISTLAMTDRAELTDFSAAFNAPLD